jgi:DNA-binding IclR family transcriptional regulator
MEDSNIHRPTARVLDILEILASEDEGLTLTEIAAAISSSKSTIFPIVRTLLERRYVDVDEPTMRYRPGVACWALSGAAGEKNDWLRTINHEMQTIVAACDEVCQLGILDGCDILYIGKVQSKKAVRLVSHVGKRLPASTTALGKAILSGLDAAAVRALYPGPLPVMTGRSVSTLAALATQLEEVRANGYAVDAGESSEETICFAVALRHRGHPLAALSVSIPTFRATEEKRRCVIDEILAARQRLERMFEAADEVSLP